jgi:hypothetical protein
MSGQFPNRRDFSALAAAFVAMALNSDSVAAAQAQPGSQLTIDFTNHEGYTSIFDGVTLAGWEGQPGLWRVEGRCHCGRNSKRYVCLLGFS